MEDQSKNQKNYRIYGELERLLVLADLPHRWQTRSAPAGYLESPQSPEQLLERLRVQFPLADLVAAGVVVAPEEPGAKPQLHSQLSVPGSKWLALRETPDSEPFDLVWDGGTLSGNLPVLAVHDDHLTRSLLLQSKCDLLVTGTVEDAAVLLAAGLPATVSAGLKCLQQELLQKFCQAFALYRPGDPRATPSGKGSPDEQRRHAVEPKPPPPIVVGWSPGQLCLEAATQNQVREHLEDLDRQLHIPFEGFYWWQPSPEHLKNLAFAVRMLDAGRLTDFLVDSIDQSTSLVRTEPSTQPPPKAAAAVFGKAPKHSFLDPTSSEKRSAERWKVLEREVFAPLLQEANKSSDGPLQRNLKLTLVQVSTALHNRLERFNDACSSTKRVWDDEDGGPAKLSQLSSLVDMFLKLTREIQSQAS